MNDINNNESYIKRCKCNSTKCFINKGIYLNENNNKHKDNYNIILHKYRCCKSCKSKYKKSDISNTQIYEEEIVNNKQMKTKLNGKGKEDKKKQGNTSDKKKNIEEDLRKKCSISKESWNSSTKVNKNEKSKIDEMMITKQNTKKIKTSQKSNSSKSSIIKEDNLNEEKKDREHEKERRKDKSVKKENKIDLYDEYDEETEPIYISYSLKGFIKIKTNSDLEICDKYYIGSKEMYRECYCDCLCEEKESIQNDLNNFCCEGCNVEDNECLLMGEMGESNKWKNRCICNN